MATQLRKTEKVAITKKGMIEGNFSAFALSRASTATPIEV